MEPRLPCAGLVLTIGMGVDSNVLIFERIREELATATGARAAVHAAFDRVWITIVDTHVASLLAAAVLFQFGTSAVRGFALTLALGLLANVFTAVFVSKTIFDLVYFRPTPMADHGERRCAENGITRGNGATEHERRVGDLSLLPRVRRTNLRSASDPPLLRVKTVRSAPSASSTSSASAEPEGRREAHPGYMR